MEDKRVLFSVSVINDEVTETMCSGVEMDDMKRIVTSILAICQESSTFKHMLHLMLHALDEDEEFANALKESTADAIDFNKLLNNNKPSN